MLEVIRMDETKSENINLGMLTSGCFYMAKIEYCN